MKLDKNIIIAGLCGILIGAGGFALVDKPKQRAFHQMPQHNIAMQSKMHDTPMHSTLKSAAKGEHRQMPRNNAQAPIAQRQMHPMEEVFAKLDTNSDNKLDSSEVKGGVLARNFESFDTNKDGFISIEEFEIIKKHHAQNRQGQGDKQRQRPHRADG